MYRKQESELLEELLVIKGRLEEQHGPRIAAGLIVTVMGGKDLLENACEKCTKDPLIAFMKAVKHAIVKAGWYSERALQQAHPEISAASSHSVKSVLKFLDKSPRLFSAYSAFVDNGVTVLDAERDLPFLKPKAIVEEPESEDEVPAHRRTPPKPLRPRALRFADDEEEEPGCPPVPMAPKKTKPKPAPVHEEPASPVDSDNASTVDYEYPALPKIAKKKVPAAAKTVFDDWEPLEREASSPPMDVEYDDAEEALMAKVMAESKATHEREEREREKARRRRPSTPPVEERRPSVTVNIQVPPPQPQPQPRPAAEAKILHDGRCNGLTKKGERCKLGDKHGGYCHLHGDQARSRSPSPPRVDACDRQCTGITAKGVRCLNKAQVGRFTCRHH